MVSLSSHKLEFLYLRSGAPKPNISMDMNRSSGFKSKLSQKDRTTIICRVYHLLHDKPWYLHRPKNSGVLISWIHLLDSKSSPTWWRESKVVEIRAEKYFTWCSVYPDATGSMASALYTELETYIWWSTVDPIVTYSVGLEYTYVFIR